MTHIAGMAALLGMLSTSRVANADDEELQLRWNYLVSGWLAEREKLSSAELTVEVAGQRFGHSALEPPFALVDLQESFDVSVTVAFDSLNRRFFQDSNWSNSPAWTRRWILSEEKLIQWSDQSREYGFVVIQTPEQRTSQPLMRLDPRAIGPFGFQEIVTDQSNDPFPFAARFLAELSRPIEVEDMGDGRFRVLLKSSFRELEWHSRLVMNETNGFSVESISQQIDPSDLSESADSTVRVKWKQIDDCWLPVHSDEVRHSGLVKYTCAYHWKSVNEAIAPEIFDYEQHESTQGMLVLDGRLGQDNAFIIGKVGDDDYLAPSLLAAQPTSRRTRLFVILGANLILLLGLIVAVCVKRARKDREGQPDVV